MTPRRETTATFAPTREQQVALDLFATGRSLAIEAGAGAGKTSTLRLLAESTERRGQYVAFNRAIVEEAKAKMPPNVRCSTAHGLAFRDVGRDFAHRLNSERMRSHDIALRLGLDPIVVTTPEGVRKRLAPGYLAGLTMRSVTAFCQSPDEEPLPEHIPYIVGIDYPPGAMHNNEIVRAHVLPAVLRAWADLNSLNGSLPYRHDHYLKSFHLSGPRIPVDFILFDEAQDANPVMVAIVAAQTHAQLVWVGDSCQPAGTLVQRVRAVGAGRRPTVVEEVPIEQIEEGDLVVSYDIATGHLHRRGNRVLGVSMRTFVGSLVQIDAGMKWVGNYTPDHHCLAKLGPAFAGKHVVYLMRRGQSYRIGRASGSYDGGGFGPLARAKKEGADALWILSAHSSASEAAAAEALTSHRFGIPGMLFNAALNRLASQEAIDGFWSAVGDLTASAERCLNWHERDLRFPLWQIGDSNLLMRRATRVRASNLMTGMHVPVVAAAQVEWAEARVGRRGPTEGCPVYSMTVENDHTYVGDGIVTHNCQQIYSFTGAVNALASVPAEQRAFLTRSFRFGPAIADVANVCLEGLDAELRIEGAGGPSAVHRTRAARDPKVLLTRTNAEAVRGVLDALREDKTVHLVGGGAEIVSFARAADRLKRGERAEHPELACFDDWNEVLHYVEQDHQGGELRLLVTLVEDFGVPTILAALDEMAPEAAAGLVVSTAHKSKGREWDSVRLASDFADAPEGEELRLLYVAVTRARRWLDVSAVPYFDERNGGGGSGSSPAPDLPRGGSDRASTGAGGLPPQHPPAPSTVDRDCPGGSTEEGGNIMADSATSTAKPDPKNKKSGGAARRGSGSNSASNSTSGNQAAPAPVAETAAPAVDLVKALTEAVQKTVNGAKHVSAKKAGYGRLVDGKKTLAYVKPRKRGGLTIDVPKGSGSYEKVVVEDEKGIGPVATQITELAKKEAVAS